MDLDCRVDVKDRMAMANGNGAAPSTLIFACFVELSFAVCAALQHQMERLSSNTGVICSVIVPGLAIKEGVEG